MNTNKQAVQHRLMPRYKKPTQYRTAKLAFIRHHECLISHSELMAILKPLNVHSIALAKKQFNREIEKRLNS